MTDERASLFPSPPAWMPAFDGGEWAWYVHGHDEDELHVVDDPECLRWENLWMRPIRASQALDYGVFVDDCEDTVERDKETGRFVPRWCWIECAADDREAEPFMGVRPK